MSGNEGMSLRAGDEGDEGDEGGADRPNRTDPVAAWACNLQHGTGFVRLQHPSDG